MTPIPPSSLLAAAVAGEQFAAQMRAIVKRLEAGIDKAPGAYVPKVGDVVAFHGQSDVDQEWVVVDALRARALRNCRTHIVGALTALGSDFSNVVYLRPATPAERIAAGIDAPPASHPASDSLIITKGDDGLWSITKGALPKGLMLVKETGEIIGTPASPPAEKGEVDLKACREEAERAYDADDSTQFVGKVGYVLGYVAACRARSAS